MASEEKAVRSASDHSEVGVSSRDRHWSDSILSLEYPNAILGDPKLDSSCPRLQDVFHIVFKDAAALDLCQ